jgi:heme/copper-type cytochrome/quinol oxidase subunit 2
MQDPASPVAEGLTELHDVIMFYILVIGVGVAWIMLSQIAAFKITKAPISHRYYNHGTVDDIPSPYVTA